MLRALVLFALAVTGCTGNISGSTSASACTDVDVPLAPLRRLTRAEYDRTVVALVGGSRTLASAFSQDQKIGAFDSNAAAVSEIQVTQYQTAAQQLAAQLASPGGLPLPCDPAQLGAEACATQVIQSFGPRVYRRPLSADEVANALALWAAGDATGGFQNGLRVLLEGLFQSPNFLYHVESGGPRTGEALVALSGDELANRLSYFLWDSMPDEALRSAAQRGELADPAVLEQQVRRMLDDPQASTGVASFHLQWLGVDGIDGLQKDGALFPSWSPALAASMRTEVKLFSDWFIRDSDATLSTLLTTTTAFADGPLARVYGASHPMGDASPELIKLQLDGTQRAGVLTRASVLAIHAHENQTSPVHRGGFVREQLFCSPLPAPPPNVDTTPPGLDPTKPTKERFSMHSASSACSGCHSLMDPIGFGFEHYDATGAWREKDGENPVDATGELLQTDVDGPFDGAIALQTKLAGSTELKDCLVTQWTRFALGRLEQEEDACTVSRLKARFAAGTDVRDLIVALATSDAMRLMRTDD